MIKTFVIDLFCGAGGTSTAVFESNTNIEVVACINHDKNAILSHEANYPNCLHFTEDIRTIGLQPLKELTAKLRFENPNCKIAIWASLECTNYSKAKGGQSRDADSRSLADHLFRYLNFIKPDFLWIENVREFMTWGPLDDNGIPIKDRKCEDYNRWVNQVKDYGFHYDHRLLNSADFGAYTSRERYFAQFSKDPELIAWPKQTHAKTTKKNLPLIRQSSLQKWKPVREVLNLNDEGVSIFERKKPLSDNTLKRIYAGLVKFAPNGGTGFLSSYYGNGTLVDMDSPCGTLTTKDRFNKVEVKPWLVNMNSSTSPSKDVDCPAPTITTARTHYLINPSWFNMSAGSVDNPCATLIARMDKSPLYLVSASSGMFDIPIYETDSEPMIEIKKFMAQHEIVDIKMRMLQISEMLRIQGFPEWYRLKGTQTEQKKYIGNSVEVTVGKVMFQAIDSKIQKFTYAAISI